MPAPCRELSSERNWRFWLCVFIVKENPPNFPIKRTGVAPSHVWTAGGQQWVPPRKRTHVTSLPQPGTRKHHMQEADMGVWCRWTSVSAGMNTFRVFASIMCLKFRCTGSTEDYFCLDFGGNQPVGKSDLTETFVKLILGFKYFVL